MKLKTSNSKKNLPDKLLNNLDLVFFSVIIFFKLLFSSIHISTFFSLIDSLPGILTSVIVLSSVPLLFKNKRRMKLFYIFDIVISLIILSDLIYFRYSKDLISLGVIRNGLLLGGVQSSVKALINPIDFIYILDIFILIPFMRKYRKMERPQIVFSKRLTRFLVTLIVGTLLNFGCIIRLHKAQPKLLATMFNRLYIGQVLGDINFHVLDIYSFTTNVMKKTEALPDSRLSEIKTTLNQNVDTTSKNFASEGKDKNLIVIQVEALQGFTINRKINGKEITPNLNRWLKKCKYYDNYFYQISGGNTSDAEFMANNSLYPASSGAAYYLYSGNYFNSLPKLLENKGYTTAAFHAYKESFWNRNVMYQTQSFGSFSGESSYNIDEIVGMGLSDKSFLNQTLKKMKKLQEPYYSFIVTLTSHFPFDAISHYGEFDVGEFDGSLLGNYLKSIHYADEQLGMFLDKLEQEGITQKSIIALYGDHYAIPKSQASDLYKLTDAPNNNDLTWFELQKVPLLVHFPDDAHSGVDHTYTGQMDILPGIATLYDLPKTYMLGKDLFNPTNQNVVFRNGSFTDGKYFYVSWANTYYDVKTGKTVPATPELKKKKEEALEQLSISDDILDHNLIKQFDSKSKNK